MEEEIIAKLQKWIELLKRFSPESDHEAIDTMTEALGERLAECPYASRLQDSGCRPGGLLEASLRIASLAKKQVDALDDPPELDEVKGLIRAALLHDLGKLGDVDEVYWVNQDSEWHREKLGELYKIKDGVSKMKVEQRTLYLLQHFGIPLTRPEWTAILLSHSTVSGDNRFYNGYEPIIAVLLQNAKRVFEIEHRK